jgi:hypothetical protein
MFAIATGPALALACILSAATGDADPDQRPLSSIPKNIRVDSALITVVDSMLLHSPTFRAQCARLQDVTCLRIRLSVDLKRIGRRNSSRADCAIRRYEYGFIDATVQLRSLSQTAELIAHEFEHVLEYLEGVDHRAESRRDHREVWMVEDSRFETTRAIDAGRRVAAEVARSRSARVNEPHP